MVTEWQKPSALEGVTAADLVKVKLAVAAGAVEVTLKEMALFQQRRRRAS